MERFIEREKSIIVAADVEAARFEELVKQTCVVEGIGAVKVGFTIALGMGLPKTVDTVRKHSSIPVIYDHQKAGNDIPDLDSMFASVCKNAGVDAIILFPFGGPDTEERWIQASQDAGLTVLVGGHMTHKRFLERDGGYIANSAPGQIYQLAVENNVRDFVVPGNQVHLVKHYRELLEGLIGNDDFRLYSPGFVAQGGEVTDYAQHAGRSWHAIVGRGIFEPSDMRAAAQTMTRQIR